MAKKNVAQVIVDTLVERGVRGSTGWPGIRSTASRMRFCRHEHIRWTHVRHEETAAFAAGAEAHLTGRLAVCAGSCGPGNLHLINGLYDCHRSRVPVLAIAAQIPSREIGSGYFQETHPEHLFAECSHYCELVSHPEQMPRLLEIAIQTRSSRRGVSVIVLPGDVACGRREQEPRLHFPSRAPRLSVRDEIAAGEDAECAKKVTILGGAGCAARTRVIALASKLQGADRARDARQGVHRVRQSVRRGHDRAARVLVRLPRDDGLRPLLMLGTDFPYQQFFPEGCEDRPGRPPWRAARPAHPARPRPRRGRARRPSRRSCPSSTQNEDDNTCRRRSSTIRRRGRASTSWRPGEPGKKPIHPQYVARVLDELAAEDAIFTCDVGTPTVWAARYLTMNGQRRLLGSFTHGSMANALPQAIGAQVSHPGRQVVRCPETAVSRCSWAIC